MTAASSPSETRGVYGVTKELGETVVGCEMPRSRKSAEQGLALRMIIYTF